MAVDRNETQVNRPPIVVSDTESDGENQPPQSTISTRRSPLKSSSSRINNQMEYLDTHSSAARSKPKSREVIDIADSPFGSKSSGKAGGLFATSSSGSINSTSSQSLQRPSHTTSAANRPVGDDFDRSFGSSILGMKKNQKSQGYGGYIKPATPNAFKSSGSTKSTAQQYPLYHNPPSFHDYSQAFRPSSQFLNQPQRPPQGTQQWPTWVTQSQPFPGTYPTNHNYPVPPVKNKEREEPEDDGVEREVFDMDVRLTAADYERHNGDSEAHMRELLSGAVGEGEADDGGFEDGDDVIEGFAKGVRLMPHQVRGVKWMRGRETGRKYGGILADVSGDCPA